MKVGNDPVAVSCALLRRLQAELSDRRTELLFVIQYGGLRVLVKKPTSAVDVVTCARQAGIDTLDLWDDFVAVHDRSLDDYGKLWAYYDGSKIFGHMSSLGNRFVAERIAARLVNRRATTN